MEVNKVEIPFSPPMPFRPVWWLRGPHAQTVVPYFIPTGAGPYQAEQHRLRLEDGDTLVLHDDQPQNWVDGDRVVLLIHGLGGYHGSPYLVRLAERCVQNGFRVLRMDMRGCGAGLMLANGVFHADRHQDLLSAVQFLTRRMPASPLTVAGFSLGANLLLKMLGVAKDRLPPQLDSAIAVSPPVDLYYCCRTLSRGLGWIYDKFFARILWRDFEQRRASISGAQLVQTHRRPRTLLEFDRLVTAPIAGFASVEDYYSAASSKNVLAAIEVPTVILAADDDPIVPPVIYEGLDFSACSQVFVTNGGGHLGYYGHAEADQKLGDSKHEDRDLRWMDRQVSRWIDEWDRRQRSPSATTAATAS